MPYLLKLVIAGQNFRMRRYVPETGDKDDPESAADVGIGHHASRGKAHSERLE